MLDVLETEHHFDSWYQVRKWIVVHIFFCLLQNLFNFKSLMQAACSETNPFPVIFLRASTASYYMEELVAYLFIYIDIHSFIIYFLFIFIYLFIYFPCYDSPACLNTLASTPTCFRTSFSLKMSSETRSALPSASTASSTRFSTSYSKLRVCLFWWFVWNVWFVWFNCKLSPNF